MTSTVAWDASPVARLDGDPGATIALDRAAWERAGASFSQADDGQGEQPWLATGSVDTTSGSVRFGVLDYGEELTYLLTPRGSRTLAREVVEGLADVGALDRAKDVVDVVGAESPPDLELRLASIEVELAAVRLLSRQAVAPPLQGPGRLHTSGPPLTPPQERVLLAISALTPGLHAGASLGAIAEVSGTTLTSAELLLKTLERRRLVSREDRDDAQLWELAPAGRAAVEVQSVGG